ncbi:MAG: serine O-acetyltransferase [Syntrophales bacterium]
MKFFKTIREDIETVFKKDPAARGAIEVLTCYPGLHAIWMHRIAHHLWVHGWLFCARFLSHMNRFLTGIEIHPGAKIGRHFFIDHGSGVVIGETSEIGDDVHLYQGVVLGGVTLQKKKRHPTVGNHVMIGAGTIVLGPIVIGDGARIGAASLVIHDVPTEAIAVGVPARLGLGFSGKEIQELTDNKLPDPIADAFKFLGRQIEILEKRMADIEQHQGIRVELDQCVEEKKQRVMRIFLLEEDFSVGAGI